MRETAVKVMVWGSAAGWALGGVDAFLADHLLTEAESRWLLVTCAVVAIIGAAKMLHRPVHQVWDAGHEAGRREALRDVNVRAVVQLAEVRAERLAQRDERVRSSRP